MVNCHCALIQNLVIFASSSETMRHSGSILYHFQSAVQ